MKKKIILAAGAVALLFSVGTAQAHGGFSWLFGKKHYHHAHCGHHYGYHHHKHHYHRARHGHGFIW